jgi:ADP-ribose pyrophosphatase YjhB (NUDIX family)
MTVRPTYHRDWWLMPGGGGELSESPRQTCERELVEELGVKITVGGLLAVDWIPARDSQGFAELLYVFDGGRLGAEEAAAIRLPDTELPWPRVGHTSSSSSECNPWVAPRRVMCNYEVASNSGGGGVPHE